MRSYSRASISRVDMIVCNEDEICLAVGNTWVEVEFLCLRFLLSFSGRQFEVRTKTLVGKLKQGNWAATIWSLKSF